MKYPYFDHYNGGSDSVYEIQEEAVSDTAKYLVKKIKTLEAQNAGRYEILTILELYSDFAGLIKDMSEQSEHQVSYYNQLVYFLERALAEEFVYLDEWGSQKDMNLSAKNSLGIYNAWVYPPKPFGFDYEDYKTNLKSEEKNLWRKYFINATVKSEVITTGLNKIIKFLPDKSRLESMQILGFILETWGKGELKVDEELYITLTRELLKKATVMEQIELEWKELVMGSEAPQADEYLELRWYNAIRSFKYVWSELGKLHFASSNAPAPATGISNKPSDTNNLIADIKPIELDEFVLDFQPIKNMDNISADPVSKSDLKNNPAKFVVTGTFGLSRDKIENLITAHKLQILPTVKPDTILVKGFNPGSKLDKAKEHNTRVIDFGRLLIGLSTGSFLDI